jgi:hypothetical protein
MKYINYIWILFIVYPCAGYGALPSDANSMPTGIYIRYNNKELRRVNKDVFEYYIYGSYVMSNAFSGYGIFLFPNMHFDIIEYGEFSTEKVVCYGEWDISDDKVIFQHEYINFDDQFIVTDGNVTDFYFFATEKDSELIDSILIPVNHFKVIDKYLKSDFFERQVPYYNWEKVYKKMKHK